jgi:hypothetical protein
MHNLLKKMRLTAIISMIAFLILRIGLTSSFTLLNVILQ